MKYRVTFTKEKVVIIRALDEDDLQIQVEKYERQGWNYEHASEEQIA